MMLVGGTDRRYLPAVTAPAARPRPQARWKEPPAVDPAVVAALASELSLPPVVCELLVRRGFGESDGARRFLRPRLDQLHPPSSMRDLDVAVERLAAAIEAGETILVHGDYDVDGMCSTALLTTALRALGGVVVPFIPRRLEDGYDLGGAGVRAAVAAGAKVVVTCDCGTRAITPVAELMAAGIDVIVSDHHKPDGEDIPVCLAVLNPHREGCRYPDKGLAAVGVAFKLALALTQRMGGNENVVLRQLDLVALATVADIAPLTGENRVLVRYGLKLLGETSNRGLRALTRAAGLEGKPLTAGRVGFILAPRLNAVGRLGHALRGVELLLAQDDHTANTIARELEELNRKRQDIDRATLAEAQAMVAAMDLDATYGLVLAGEGWHPGVIGIVASRIVEQTGRPAMLIALDKGEGKGSGRSVSAFSLVKALDECRDLFVRFGGHDAAAGVTIRAENVPAFAERFNRIAREHLKPEDLVPELRTDLELPIEAATPDLEQWLRHFEPFGSKNAAPLLVSRGVRLSERPRLAGQDGLKLRLENGAGGIEAIGWGLGWMAAELEAGATVDVAYRLERDDYRGESRLVAKLADVVPR